MKRDALPSNTLVASGTLRERIWKKMSISNPDLLDRFHLATKVAATQTKPAGAG